MPLAPPLLPWLGEVLGVLPVPPATSPTPVLVPVPPPDPPLPPTSVKRPPRPPPAEVIVPKTEFEPTIPTLLFPPAPPAPIVTV